MSHHFQEPISVTNSNRSPVVPSANHLLAALFKNFKMFLSTLKYINPTTPPSWQFNQPHMSHRPVSWPATSTCDLHREFFIKLREWQFWCFDDEWVLMMKYSHSFIFIVELTICYRFFFQNHIITDLTPHRGEGFLFLPKLNEKGPEERCIDV